MVTGTPSLPERKEVSQVAPETTESAASVDANPLEADLHTRESLAETGDEILHAETTTELEAAKESYAAPASDTGVPAASPAHESKDEVMIEVEKVLEEGVGQFFQALPQEAKPLFKKRGEDAARQISEMVRTLKLQVKTVTKLILLWLKTIPGVNKFFLEQEAKIKTDRIIELVEARKSDRGNQV